MHPPFAVLELPAFFKATYVRKFGTLCVSSGSCFVSERKIGESIKSIFQNIKGRILISTFASNVYRVQQIVEASISVGRKVIVYGRSMEKTIKIALKNGYIKATDSAFIKSNDLKNFRDDQITVITTGSQGEPLAALSRIANGTHKQVKIHNGDTIIFSSSAIPGNQEGINRTINKLYKAGANVIVNSPLADTHTSGHASETELKIMLSLVKPKYFIPIHGEYSMQKRHVDLAIATGVDSNNCFILDNGKVVTFNENKVFSLYSVQSGNVYIDEDNIDIDNVIMRERKILGEDGLVSIIYTINKDGSLVRAPNLITRGFIYMKNTDFLMKSIRNRCEQIYTSTINSNPNISRYQLNGIISNDVASFIQQKTERKPIIVPIYMEC